MRKVMMWAADTARSKFNFQIVHNTYRLASRIHEHITPNSQNLIRITSNGELFVNGNSIRRKFCARLISDSFQLDNKESRNIYLFSYPNADTIKIAQVIRGLATGNLRLVEKGRGLMRVITQDYSVTHMLSQAGVDYVKASPNIDLDLEKIKRLDGALLRNPPLAKFLTDLHRTQRNAIIEGVVGELLHGVLDGFALTSNEDRGKLAAQIALIDYKLLKTLIEKFSPFIECIAKEEKPSQGLKRLNVKEFAGNIEAYREDDVVNLMKLRDVNPTRLDELKAKGEEQLKKGTHALFVLAAGKGARFGGNLPKGIFKIFEKLSGIRPEGVSEEFSFLASAIKDGLKFEEKYGKPLPIIVMVSPENRKDIEDHLIKNAFFGYNPQHIFITYQTAAMPRIYPKSKTVALKRDEKGLALPSIDMVPTGHGFVLDSLQNKNLFKTISDIMNVDVQTVTLRNVDNLGATVSDEEFAMVMGSLIKTVDNKEIASGIAIELTQPEMNEKTGKQKDPGGSPVFSKIHDRNVLMEGADYIGPANEALWEKIATSPYPFNTLTTTLSLDSLKGLKRDQMPWYVVKKEVPVFGDPWPRIQFEQMWGDITKLTPVNFVEVDRSMRFFPSKKPENVPLAVADFLRASKAKGIALAEPAKNPDNGKRS
jgi:hypothetical protein